MTTSSGDAVRTNGDMQLVINNGPNHIMSTGVFVTGKYYYCGFVFVHTAASFAGLPGNQLYCAEEARQVASGAFCVKVMGYNASSYYDTPFGSRYYY